MRNNLLVLLVAMVCLLAPVAEAEIARISPTSFTPSGEDYIAIFGTNLTGNVSTTVVFDGAIEVEPQSAAPDQLFVWVPVEVLVVNGQHCLTVRSTDLAGVRTHGPACFTVQLPNTGGSAPPVLVLPEIVGAEAESAQGAVVTYEASAYDAAGEVALTCTRASGSMFPLATTRVVCSATNAHGTSTGDFLVVVTDTTPPVLTLPADIDTANPVVTFTATAVDHIDGAVAVSCSPASGSTFNPGTTRVNCVAFDSRFNSVFGSFRVRVAGGAPALELPEDIVEEATKPGGAAVTFTATADDGSPVICSPASGSTFALGTTTVHCTATNAGGTSSGTFKVTVLDTTPPQINAPALVTAEASSPSGATVTYVVTAFDLVDEDVPVFCAPPSGSLFSLGVTDVACTASDERQPPNSDSTSFQVRVQDTTPPAVTSVSASPSSLWPPNHAMIPVTVSAKVVDAVDTAPAVKIVSVSSNQPVNGTGDGDTAPDWVITGPMTLQLRAERAGNSTADRVYTIRLQARDAAGNIGIATVEVRVMDNKRRSVRP